MITGTMSLHTHRVLREAVGRQCAVSGRVGRVCGEVGEGEREVMRIKRERHRCQRHCRELIAQIEVSWKFLSVHVSTHKLEMEGLQHSMEHLLIEALVGQKKLSIIIDVLV